MGSDSREALISSMGVEASRASITLDPIHSKECVLLFGVVPAGFIGFLSTRAMRARSTPGATALFWAGTGSAIRWDRVVETMAGQRSIGFGLWYDFREPDEEQLLKPLCAEIPS